MMSQKDAVFAAIQSATEQGLSGTTFNEFVVEQLRQGLMSGEIKHKKGALPEKEALAYAKQLVSNWNKKDVRLTNGVKYEPATRRGPINKDEILKKLSDSLKSLRVNSPENGELIAKVEAAIAARRAELAQQKQAKTVQSLDETFADLAALGITA